MRKKKLFIALPLALGLLVGSALYVRAAEGDSSLACADIIAGQVSYAAPSQDSLLGEQGWISSGRLDFVGTAAAPTCLDVQYGIVALEEDPTVSGVPRVLASATVPGDGVNNKFAFDLAIPDWAGDKVCVYAYTVGAAGQAAPEKSGAPFAGASASTLIDRAPDGPESLEYCNEHHDDGGGGSRGYN